MSTWFSDAAPQWTSEPQTGCTPIEIFNFHAHGSSADLPLRPCGCLLTTTADPERAALAEGSDA